MSPHHALDPLLLFAGPGQARAALREAAWASSPLGEPSSWPPSVNMALSLALGSKLPIALLLGPELCLLYNDAYAALLAHRHPGAIGRPLWEAWPETREALGGAIALARDGSAQLLEDFELALARDGAPQPAFFNISLSPLRDESGAVIGVFNTALDRTSRVLADRDARAQTARLSRLFEQAPGFIAVTRGPEHAYELVNTALSNMMGAHRAYIGLPVRQAVPELEQQGFFELLDRVYRTGQAYIGRAVPADFERSPGGPRERRYMNFIYQPIMEDNGGVRGIFVEGSDVTDERLAQLETERLNFELAAKVAQLSEADRRKDEFLAMLAHELRNPLAPISAAAELLSSASMSEEQVAQTSAIIARQARHMSGLINDLLDVSRVTSGLIDLRFEQVDINRAIAEAVEQALPLMQARSHRFTQRPLPGRFTMMGDAKRITQIVVNLLNNAAKYTPDGGRIELSVERAGEEARISVSDNGQGMRPDLLDRVFEPFEQAERSSDRSQGGLGLGLALVKSLCALHGGSASAQSAGLGLGSVFSVHLPAVQSPAEEPVAPGWTPAGARRGPAKILIVDDNHDAALMLSLLLEAAGYQTTVENSAHDALARSPELRPDACFLDIGLPEMDGIELCARLKALPELKDCVFCALTGYGLQSDRDRTASAGFERHFVKPASASEMTDALQELLPWAGSA